MTKNLPDELLFTIFEDLSSRELLHCQRVCRSWYSPAKRRLLKEVELKSVQAIQKFIASFDLKSNQTYCKAVNSIRIHSRTSYGQQWILDRETVENLLFQFPNLNKVYFNKLDLIRNFDEELCKVLLLKCPKLDIFHVDAEDTENDFNVPLERVRSLLTNLELSRNNIFSEIGDPAQFNPIQFITQFPRLQSLVCEYETVRSFDRILPVFEQLANIKTLRLALWNDIEADFGERYSSPLVLQRLSNITDLYLTAKADIVYTLKFVVDNCTGINNFKLASDSVDRDTVFCERTFYALPFLRGNCNLELHHMRFTTLSSTFSGLIEHMFDMVPAVEKQSKCRALELFVDDQEFHSAYVDLSLNTKQSPLSRKAVITYNNGMCLSDFANRLLNTCIPIEIFKVSYNEISYEHNSLENAGTFLSLLRNMPLLKQVELELPVSFRDDYQYHESYESDYGYNRSDVGSILYQVEEATFTVADGVTIQSLLNNCCKKFPNLKRLNINNFVGFWRSHMGEFLLDLPGYSLKTLTVDVDPVVRKTKKYTADFFVLELEILDRCRSEQRLYKISQDFLSCEVVNDLGLIRFRRRYDYPRLRLTVSYCKQVVLFVHDFYKDSRCVITLDDDYYSDDKSTV